MDSFPAPKAFGAGYLRSVPSGQIISTFVHKFGTASLFEDDESEDEDEDDFDELQGSKRFEQKSDRISKIATARAGVYCSYLT